MAKPVKPADIDVMPEAIILWDLESNINALQGYLAVTGDKQAAEQADKISASVIQLHKRAEELLTMLGVPIPTDPNPSPRSGGGK